MEKMKRGPLSGIASRDRSRYIFDVMNTEVESSGEYPDCVFFGDGLVERMEVAYYFGKYGKILNRGSENTTIEDNAFAFDYDVKQLKPKIMVYWAGSHEIVNANLDGLAGQYIGEYGNYERIFSYLDKEIIPKKIKAYKEILKKAKKCKIKTIVLSVTPVAHTFNVGRDYRNYYVNKINFGLKKLCRKYKFDFLDVSSDLKQENGTVNPEFTWDGYNLKGEKYREVAQKLTPYFDKYFGLKK